MTEILEQINANTVIGVALVALVKWEFSRFFRRFEQLEQRVSKIETNQAAIQAKVETAILT